MGKRIEKILLVQLYSNGDCLYATTVARQIKNDYPDCHITWAIASFCKDIINLNPFVDNVRIVDDVAKNDIIAFRKFKKKVLNEKETGIWDKVIITSNLDDNQALYDGTIRGMILRAYPGKITVPYQPVLVLSEHEKKKVADFAKLHKLSSFKNIILWEYAPQSGQNNLDFHTVKLISEKLISNPDTCVILSAANSFDATEKIIDASKISVRENAELSKYCTLLIGSSSGITWLCTSSAGKMLPMVQLLNPNAIFLNAPSVDFNRIHLSTESLIEMVDFNQQKIYECVNKILNQGFKEAKEKFNQNTPLQFFTTRKIVYNLLCYLQFKAILKHISLTFSVYGIKVEFIKQLLIALVTFPFQLLFNTFSKRIKSKKAIKI